jgi:hypothetical protein
MEQLACLRLGGNDRRECDLLLLMGEEPGVAGTCAGIELRREAHYMVK